MRQPSERKLWLVTCVASMAGMTLALLGCGGPQREVRADPYPVVYAKAAPRIDGKLDDAVWQDAVLFSPFYEFRETGVKVDVAQGWMAWDEDNLYLAVTVQDRDLFVTESERDALLCRADVVELFIKPPVQSRYEFELYEFEFNVWEAIWDIHYAGRGGGSAIARFGKPYTPAIVCKATHKGTINDWSDVDEEYTIEVSIPLSAFSHAVPDGVKAGDVWRFNIAGYDFSVYRHRALLFTSVDGNTKGFAEYELYPEMIFLAP